MMPVVRQPWPSRFDFGQPLKMEMVQWVRPELIAHVRYLAWTADRLLCQPSYLGFREDEPAQDIVRSEVGRSATRTVLGRIKKDGALLSPRLCPLHDVVANESGIIAKTALALARRDAAKHARDLASSVLDKRAQEGLENYALELEAEASAIDDEIAALKEADKPATASNVVPLKPLN